MDNQDPIWNIKILVLSFFQTILVFLYDFFIGEKKINDFDKVISIAKWEEPYLEKLGVKKEKIVYIPNGIPDEFFEIKTKKGKNILFLGRISPVKNLEILIKAMKKTNLQLDIIGPVEKDYKERLERLVKTLNLSNISFKPPIYNLKEKIFLIDNYEIFVLPSKREAMPQSLIETMAREKIVISSDNTGSKEIINNNNNGFLFQIGNKEELSNIIKNIQSLNESEKKQIKIQARRTSEKFKWSKLINKLISIF